MKISTAVHGSSLPKPDSSGKRPNISGCHGIFKIKTLDNGSLMAKCRFAPLGNEDDDKDELRSDSANSSPMAFSIFLSTCSNS